MMEKDKHLKNLSFQKKKKNHKHYAIKISHLHNWIAYIHKLRNVAKKVKK